ncbi:MAG: YvcK family protein [Clostridia bacterium]|nr:YvcK family protein [Clostridia bacterium]
MNGILNWFKSSTKIKRWIFLILGGIILACISLSKLLSSESLGIMDILLITLTFITGSIVIVFGIVFIQKRMLELLVQETDDRAQNGDVKSLIFNKKVYNDGPKVVVLGGGKGLNTVIKGLKNYTSNITAIVTVSDYGEQASDSRKLLNLYPLEEIKDSLVALSNNEEIVGPLMDYKFKRGRLDSLCFGDIYLEAMQELYGDFSKAIEDSNKVLDVQGKVLPVTLEEIKICAELEDGTVIENKHQIPEKMNERTGKISRIFISPSNCRVAPKVLEALREADAIIIGPGSLYTNVIPNLLVKGVSKAIRESKAFKIYISNIMTELGQTDNYSLSDHIKAINEHVGNGVVDYCIYDTGEIIPEIIRKCNLKGEDIVEQDIAKAKTMGVKLIQRNLSRVIGDKVVHDSDAIAASIIQLICDDLKFRDQQNDATYLMLNSKLKTKKKQISKHSKKAPIIQNKNSKKRKSKFFSKYDKRIQSIKESDLKIKEKEKKYRELSKRQRDTIDSKRTGVTTKRASKIEK